MINYEGKLDFYRLSASECMNLNYLVALIVLCIPLHHFLNLEVCTLVTKILLNFVLCTGETITVVGDHNPALLKYFDCTRSGPRSAFDGNVVYQFEIMEYVRLIHVFLINQSLDCTYFFAYIYILSRLPPSRHNLQLLCLLWNNGMSATLWGWCVLCINEPGLAVICFENWSKRKINLRS